MFFHRFIFATSRSVEFRDSAVDWTPEMFLLIFSLDDDFELLGVCRLFNYYGIIVSFPLLNMESAVVISIQYRTISKVTSRARHVVKLIQLIDRFLDPFAIVL